MISVVDFLSMSSTISLILHKNAFPSAKSIPDIETRNDFHLHFVCTYTMDIIYFSKHMIDLISSKFNHTFVVRLILYFTKLLFSLNFLTGINNRMKSIHLKKLYKIIIYLSVQGCVARKIYISRSYSLCIA